MSDELLEELFGQLESCHQEAAAIIQPFDPALVVHTDSSWTLKDLIAHIAIWEDEMVKALQARQQNTVYQISDVSPDDWDTYNHRMYDRFREESYADMLDFWHRTRQAFIDTLHAIPADQIYQKFLPPWNGAYEVNCYWLGRIALGHEREHIQQIKQAAGRKSTSP
jgi:DinB superfamily